MDEQRQLEQAIAALEAQRAVLGNEVVDAALAPMRAKLASLKPRSTTEQRKLVTVLFADLAGFTDLTARMDPEDVREIIQAYFNRWRECIEENRGSVEKYIGDAVMAVFGIPLAQEDDPERAIRAALKMRGELEDLNQSLEREQGVRLAMRVGINTGKVVLSTLEERPGQDFVVVGEAVNLASRLQAAAPVGGILISHDTYRHVRGVFDVRALDPVRLKGIQEPLRVYLVQGSRPRAFRLGTRGVEGVETRMIGREGELKILQDTFREVVGEGERQVITLVGEAGIGKSRLIYEFDNWLELLPEPVIYFKGRAHPTMQNLPYALVRDVFAFRYQIQDSDPPMTVRKKLEQGIAEALGEGETGLMKAHFIGRLLGFEFGISPYLAGSSEDAKQIHQRALVYLGDYFRTLAGRNPVTVLLEDIHWADDSSLDLINRLEGSLAKQPLLIVATTRPVLFERRPNWGEGLSFYTRLELRPLSKRDSRQLLREILQRVDTLPNQLQELVVASAEGNPFYIEELVKLLVDQGVILIGEEHWRVEAERLESVQVPPTLIGLLQARLDSLPVDERALLLRASVIGRIFWDQAVEVLVQDIEIERARMADQVPVVLGRLHDREMIFRREESAFEGTREYLFKHALLRDVSYESLLKRQRRVLHANVARWLEEITQHSPRTDEYAALIAGHYEHAEEQEPAATWYRRAGRWAAARYANAEAVHALSRALELVLEGDRVGQVEILLEREKVYDLLGARQDQLKDLEDLASLVEKLEDDAYKTTVALRQARFALVTGDFPSVMDAAQRTVQLARTTDAAECEAEAYLVQAAAYIRQGKLDTAREHAERALSIASQHGLRRIEADSLRHLGLVAYYVGDPRAALQYFQGALDIYMEIGDRHGEGMALVNLGGATYNLGDYAGAGVYYGRSLQKSREIGDRVGECRALNNLGIISIEQGDYPHSEQYYLQALQICQEIGHRSYEVSMLGNLGNLYLHWNDYAQARNFHQQSLQVAREIGDKAAERFTLSNLCQSSAALGDYEDAYRYAQEALNLTSQLGHRDGQCIALYNLSRYYHELGDYETAREHSEKAVAISKEIDAPSDRAWALTCLADSLLGLRKFAEAAEAYQQALEIRQKIGESVRVAAVQAGLASAYLGQGDLKQARIYAEQVMSYLETHLIEGIDRPMRVYLACYQVLNASRDPRSLEILHKGYNLLQEWAAKIEEDALRRSFLENVPANRELAKAWKESQI